METGVVISLVIFLLGIAVGVPLGWVFLGSTALGMILLGSPLSFMAGTFFHSLFTPVVMAIGFFVFAGALISEAGLADRIVRFSYALVGKVKGGLIVVGIIATLFMSALTGSSVPCISALILLLAIGYGILNYFIVDKYTFEATEMPERPETLKDSLKELLSASWAALPALGCPVLILVGIYGGICTPNEAGALAVFYCIFVGVFIYRDLKWGNFRRATTNTLITLGMIALLLGGGTVLTRYLTLQGVAQSLAALMLGLFENKYLILISINVFLLLLGMFLDGIPILILAVPLIMPLAKELDINMVHLGSMIILNIGLGVMTPPFAMSIFVGSRLSGVPAGELMKPMLMYLLFVGIPVLMITTYVPFISCWLPTVALGSQIVGPW